jgi:hypothetical protein
VTFSPESCPARTDAACSWAVAQALKTRAAVKAMNAERMGTPFK